MKSHKEIGGQRRRKPIKSDLRSKFITSSSFLSSKPFHSSRSDNVIETGNDTFETTIAMLSKHVIQIQIYNVSYPVSNQFYHIIIMQLS